MKNASKRYTTYDKDLMLAAMKVGAQNGIPQEVIADQIAPLLMRKPSAINSQMYILRSEWLKTMKTEMTLAYSKVKCEKDELKVNETEYLEAAIEKNEAAIEPENQDEPEELVIIKPAPVLQPMMPVTGDEIEVTIVSIRKFGAIAKAVNYDLRGLIHISNVVDEYIENIEDWLYIGQSVNVVITKQEEDGRYGFSARHTTNPNVYRLTQQTT